MPPKRKRHEKAPTHEEVSAISETERLFKSNFFRLQTTELLREASPVYSSTAVQSAEGKIKLLREVLLKFPTAELSWEANDRAARRCRVSHAALAAVRLENTKISFMWCAPDRVEVVGSYILRTLARPALNIDLAVQIPAACVHEKDFLDHRYALVSCAWDARVWI